ncbi:hypothetical protein BDZ45DRAFT_697377 [Acephala macrosclerotiorum]|nr:hypothetical protein BDZ45DRAFT_697377 [Acephala macrosclerotiorum]
MSKSNLKSSGSQVLFLWKLVYQNLRSSYPSTEALVWAVMVTLTANWSLIGMEMMERQPQCHFWSYLWGPYTRLLEGAESEKFQKELEEEFEHLLKPQDEAGNAAVYRQYLDAAYHRKIFFTRKPLHLDLGPGNIQGGDILCVLFGGATPMILRLEGEHFRFVSECYAHDLMSGEAVKDW